VNASITNWFRMSTWRAPIARRTPICRVRPSTVASMMFMIPIPPTSSEIPAVAPSRCRRDGKVFAWSEGTYAFADGSPEEQLIRTPVRSRTLSASSTIRPGSCGSSTRRLGRMVLRQC
jgi:hypothetical protein